MPTIRVVFLIISVFLLFFYIFLFIQDNLLKRLFNLEYARIFIGKTVLRQESFKQWQKIKVRLEADWNSNISWP
jgi:hypothetical protein